METGSLAVGPARSPGRGDRPEVASAKGQDADRIRPGLAAKDAVDAAREAGADLARNAQGIAASGIARGASPESVFAAILPGSAEDGTDGGSDTGAVVADGKTMSDGSVEPDGIA